MSEVERARIGVLMEASKAGADQPSAGGPILGKTVRIATYPTAAQAFYGILRASVTATPVEGSTPSFAYESSDRAFLAANIGAKVPPEGTLVLVFKEGRGLAFRYG